MDDIVLRTEDDKRELISSIKFLKLDPNRPVTVCVKEPKRRLSQNALYWAWLTDISRFWNYDTKIAPPEIKMAIYEDGENGKMIDVLYVPITKDTLHDYFASYFLAKARVKMIIEGKPVYINKSPSTSSLDVRQFNEYLTKIKMLMQDVWGYVCETPSDSAFYEYFMKLDKDDA